MHTVCIWLGWGNCAHTLVHFCLLLMPILICSLTCHALLRFVHGSPHQQLVLSMYLLLILISLALSKNNDNCWALMNWRLLVVNTYTERAFFKGVRLSESKAVILSITPGYFEIFVPKSVSETVPKPRTCLYNEDYLEVTYPELLSKCDEHFRRLIRESVDSLCRDGSGPPIVGVH